MPVLSTSIPSDPFAPFEPTDQDPWDVAKVAHLLRRITFGPTNEKIDALLKAPDLRTAQGSRDYALLLFLYNTGARVEEAAHLTIDAITWSNSPAVRLVGKGNKTRSCPIWKRTVDVLKPLVAGRNTQEFVFLNRRDEPLTRFGIYSLVRRAADQASRALPSIAAKRISPHCLRHSCAHPCRS